MKIEELEAYDRLDQLDLIHYLSSTQLDELRRLGALWDALTRAEKLRLRKSLRALTAERQEDGFRQ